MLQDRLEDYIDVNVGKAEKIDPAFLVEEKFDCLIIGDLISDVIPSLEIQNWLLKYREVSNKNNLVVEVVSGFYVAPSDCKIEPFWVENIQENINAEKVFPPILRLKLSKAKLELENGALELINTYSNDFIEFFISSKG
ncbi:MAG: hypothetical protein ACW98X_06660 [Promethearchaeota archaeon]|jgi:hypothetical protein